jgi:curved DNA-binding protein CbpA
MPGEREPDHYKTLGVASDAELVTIKQRYRALVREHHPDIARDKAAATSRMVLILEAWRVLSDPIERERYDRECRERARRAASATAPKPSPPGAQQSTARPTSGPHTNGSTHHSSSRHAAPRTASGKSSSSTRQTGSTSSKSRSKASAASKSGTTKSGSSRSSKTQSSTQRYHVIDKAVEAARRSFVEGSPDEAIAICRWILKIEPKSATAAALLGDIFSQQGQRDMAILMYGRAVLNQPDNPVYRWKLDTLRRAQAARSAVAGPSQSPPPKGSAKANGKGTAPTTTIYITANTQLSKKDARRLPRLGCAGRTLLFLVLASTLLGTFWTPVWMYVSNALR